MKETDKTKEQLINELREMRRSVSELEARHKKELAELKPMEQKYLNIFDISPSGILTADKKGIVTSCNEAFLDLSGYSKEEIVGKHFTKLPTLRASDMPRWIKLFASILTGKEIKPIDFTWIRKDGTPRTGDFRVSLIKEGRRTAGVLCVVWDVTERKQIENALRESEERYRTLIDTGGSSGLGIMVIQDTEDHEATIVFSNTQASNIFGYDEEELRGKPTWPLVTPETVAVMKERNRKRKEGENVVHTYEAVGVRKDGEQVQIEISSGMMTYNGKPATVTYIKDITKRKQVVNALRESEEKFSEAFRLCPDIITLINLETGKFVEVNDSFVSTTGYTRKELIGHTRDEVNIWANGEDEEKLSRLLAKSDSIRDEEFHILTKSGDTRTWLFSADIIRINGAQCMLGVATDVTERRKSEEALRESEERFRIASEITNDVVYERDIQTGIATFYSDIDSHLGYEPGGYPRTMEGAREHIHPEDLAWIDKYNPSMITPGIPYSIEYRMRKRDGTYMTWLDSIVIVEKDGKPVKLLGVATNITERKQAEEALRISEEKYRTLVNTAGDAGLGIIVIQDTEDQEAAVVFSNDLVREITGYSPEELRGKPVWSFISLENVAMIKESYRNRQKGNDNINIYETDGICKDGTRIPIEVSTGLITYEGKLSVVAYIKDISDRKEFENALLESEERYRTLVDTAGDAGLGIVVAQDTEEQEAAIIFSNNQASDISGYSKEELEGSPIWKFIHQKDLALIQERYKERQEGKDVVSTYEVAAIRKDGTRLPIEISVGIIVYNGKPATVAYFRDITEREQLGEERQKAERLDSIGLLAGGIAHDFNNYLTSIIGNISLARKYVESRGVAGSHLLEAETAVIEARELTQQLLTFAKGGSPVKKNTSIGNLIEDTTKFALRGSKVKPEFSIPEDLWPAEVDASQIRQVISNIAINAAEAMHGGGFIQVKAENYNIEKKGITPLQKGKYLKLTFTDHGTGISEEHLKRIFDPYFTTKKSGSGLGLATTYSITKAHGGHIEVESQDGAGTVFRILLPASKKPVRKPKPKKKLHQLSLVKGSRVLVMDDNKAIRKMLDIALGMVYEVALAADGAETIKLYSEALENGNPFDVVIMDLTIPGGIGGQEAIEELLRIDPHATVIVSSGYSDHPIMSSYKKYGFSGVINKPYVIDELKETIEELIKRRKKVQQTARG